MAAPLVPHVVHQLWMQGSNAVPPKYAAARASWAANHPGWEVKTWDDASVLAMIKADYPQHAAWYEALPRMMQRCDACRGFLLHRFGGVYADMDAFAVDNFEGLVSAQASSAGPNGELLLFTRSLNNAVSVSSVGHPFWTDVFMPAVKANAEAVVGAPEVAAILKTAGPQAMKAMVRGLSAEARAGYGLVLLPEHVLEPWKLKRRRFALSPEDVAALRGGGSYSYHASDTSWMPRFSRDWVLLRFADTPTQVGTGVVLLVVVAALLATGMWCVTAACKVRRPALKAPRVGGVTVAGGPTPPQ